MAEEFYAYDKDSFRRANSAIRQLSRRENDQAVSRVPTRKIGISPPVQHRLAILTTTLEAGGTGNAQFYTGEPGEEYTLEVREVADWAGTGGTTGDRGHVFRSPYKEGVAWYFVPCAIPSFSSITRNLTSGGGAFVTTSGTLSAITFNDAGAEFGCTASEGSHSITADRNGKYVIEHGATAYALSNTLAAATVEVHKNGTYIGVGRMALSVNAVGNDAGYSWKHTFDLLAGDEITVKASVTGGGSYSLNIENPWLYVERKAA